MADTASTSTTSSPSVLEQVGNVVSGIVEGATAPARLFANLLNGAWWRRVLVGLAGFILLMFAFYILAVESPAGQAVVEKVKSGAETAAKVAVVA